MKTTNKVIKIKGIKKAIGNYKQIDNWNTYGIFYIDKNNGKIWCDLFNNCNTWNEYHNPDIQQFNPFEYVDPDYNKLTMKTLKDACIQYFKYEHNQIAI